MLPGSYRSGAPGAHVVKGKAKYRLVDEQVRYFVAPPVEEIENSPVRASVVPSISCGYNFGRPTVEGVRQYGCQADEGAEEGGVRKTSAGRASWADPSQTRRVVATRGRSAALSVSVISLATPYAYRGSSPACQLQATLHDQQRRRRNTSKDSKVALAQASRGLPSGTGTTRWHISVSHAIV